MFITTHLNYNTDFIKKFLSQNGVVIHATEKDLPSDDYGAFMRLMFKVKNLNFQALKLFLIPSEFFRFM